MSSDAPLYGPAFWDRPPQAAGKRRWVFTWPVTMVLIVAAALSGVAALTWVVRDRTESYVREQGGCAETKRMLIVAKPLLRHTLMSGDACRDVKRMQGEET